MQHIARMAALRGEEWAPGLDLLKAKHGPDSSLLWEESENWTYIPSDDIEMALLTDVDSKVIVVGNNKILDKQVILHAQ
jgi:hypothetical protein